MSERFPGGIISYTPPTLNPALGSAAPGIWTLDQVTQAVKAGTWPPYDPYYPYVTLNLHGNGTNGAQNNTFLDSSANNFNFTRNGSVTQGTFTPYGSNWSNYFSYNATAANYLTSNSLSLSGDFTIEGYVYWDGIGSIPNMFTLGDSFTSTGIEVYLGGGTNWVVYSNNATRITGAAGVKGQWTYIAVTRSGSTVTMYINGVSQGTWTSSATFSGTIRVGAEFYNGIYYSSMSGYISNFRVNNTTAINQVPTTPLTAVSGTIFLTCQSNRFIDNSSNGYTITVNGSPSVQRFSPFSPSAAYSTSVVGGSAYLASGTYITSTNGGSVASNQDFTCEGWIYFTQAIDNTSICTTAADLGVIFTTSGQTLNSYDGSFRSWGKTIPLNRWCYLVIMRSGSTAYTWIDGVYNNSFTFSAGWNWNGSGRSSFAIFGNADGANKGIGYQANWRFSTIARYNTSGSNITVPTSPLTTDANTTWLLDGTNGGIIDNAMMNDLETVGNAQISTAQSKFGGGSMYFDGTGDYLSVPATQQLVFGTGDFTVEFWVYYASASANYVFYDGRGVLISNTGFCIYNSGGTIYAQKASTTLVSATAPTANVWHHIAFSRSGSSNKLFIDGTQVGSTATDSTNYSTSYPVGIGAPLDPSYTATYGLNGYIDDLRITKGYARYTANFTPQTSQWQDQ